MPSSVPGNRTTQVNFGRHAYGIHHDIIVLSLLSKVQYCPYFTSGIQRHPNTPIDLLTNQKKNGSNLLPLYQASLRTPKNLASVPPVPSLLSSHRSHDFGIKLPLELATFRGRVVLCAF